MNYKYLFIVFNILMIFQIHSEGPGLSTFFEQRMKVEREIHSKVERALSRVIKNDSFIIDVELKVKAPTAPDWNGKDGEEGESENEEGEGEDEDEKELQAKEKAKKADISLKSKVTFDDVDLPDRKEQFVVLSKFGLEAPLIDDYRDFQPDGKILLSLGGSQDQEGELSEQEKKDQAKALSGLKDSKSEIEKLWKYNEAINIYKNLEAVNITIKLSKSLSADAKKSAELTARAIQFNLGDIQPKIEFKFIDLVGDLFSDKGVFEVLSLMSRFATPLGLLLAVILFGTIGGNLLKKYFELNTGNADSSQITMDQNKNDEDEDSKEGALGGASGEGPQDSDLLINGVDRFQSFYQQQSEDALLMVKKWLRSGGKKERLGLSALVQQMDNKTLMPLMKAMNEEERSLWKETLNRGLGPSELKEANAFIGNQIVQNLMIPEFIRDPETYAKLSRVRPADFQRLLSKDFDAACMVLTALGPEFLSKALTQIDPSTRERVLAKSLEITPQVFEEKAQAVKNLLGSVGSDFKDKPFLKSLEKLIPTANFDVEESLFLHYINSASTEKVDSLLEQNFPGFAIKELPDKFLKIAFNRYPLDKKVILLYGLEQDTRSQFMEIYAPAGSKAYELMNMEFESIEYDEIKQKQVTSSFDEVWIDFVSFVRKQLKSNEEFSQDVEEITNAWVAHNLSKASNSSNLKGAS